MPTMKMKRGATADVSAYTGDSGELVVNTDTNKIHVQDGATAGGHPASESLDYISESSNQITISNHIIPDTNAAYDLGSAEYKIRHLFLSDNSIYVNGRRVLGRDVEDDIIEVTTDPDNDLRVIAKGEGEIEIVSQGGNIYIEGNLIMKNNQIKDLKTPIENMDAATKKYVDDKVEALKQEILNNS